MTLIIVMSDYSTDFSSTKKLSAFAQPLLSNNSALNLSERQQQLQPLLSNNSALNLSERQQQLQPLLSNNSALNLSERQQQLQTSQQLIPAEPSMQVQQEPAGFIGKGSINSLIFVKANKWIATGNWSINVNNGSLRTFGSNMTWFNQYGNSTHTHEFLNFRPSPDNNIITIQQPGNNIFLEGKMDVGTNHAIIWKNVPTTIAINGEKTITIAVDDNATKHHFAPQPALGVVTSFMRCSDLPSKDMEVLPSCTVAGPKATTIASESTRTNEQTNRVQKPSLIVSITAEDPISRGDEQIIEVSVKDSMSTSGVAGAKIYGVIADAAQAQDIIKNANSTVYYNYRLIDGQKFGGFSDNNGQFSFHKNMPKSLKPGTYGVTVTAKADGYDSVSRVGTFEVVK